MVVKESHLVCVLLLVACGGIHCRLGNWTLHELLSPENEIVKNIDDIGFPLSELGNPLRAVNVIAHWKKYLGKVKHNLIDVPSPVLERMFHSKCAQDVYYTLKSLLSGNKWAFEMFDAYGKPGEAIFMGNVRWLGSYYECTKIYAPPQPNNIGDFHGQYCSLDFSIDISSLVISLTLGICIPDSCNLAEVGNEVHNLVKIYTDMLPVLNHLHSPVKLTKTACQPNSKPWTTEAIVMLCSLAFLFSLVVIGSSITAWENYNRTPELGLDQQMVTANDEKITEQTPILYANSSTAPNKPKIPVLSENVRSFLGCFCCFTSAENLFSDAGKSQFLCLHGIRFLSFCWIVLSHLMGVILLRSNNFFEGSDVFDNWPAQILLNGFGSVDSFFLLSGFLLAYHFFKSNAKIGGLQKSWIYFYVHRYVRITLPFMMVMGIYATLFYYMGYGPLWVTDEVQPLCKKYWLWNMLYINNFLSDWCMGWSWYLAADMQFYVISPLFLITFWRWPKIGYLLSALFVAITFLAGFFISYYYSIFTGFGNVFPLTEGPASLLTKYNDLITIIYNKPYTRISPYVIGIAVGYYLFTRNQQKREKMNGFILGFGWTISFCVGFTSTFYIYHKKSSLMTNSLYNGLHHTTFSVAVAWVVFVCCAEQGGIVNSILSCKLFIPLSRLTYSAYLTHVLVIHKYLDGIQLPFHYSHESLVIVYLGMLVEVYAVAFLSHLLLEAPFVRLEIFVMSKFKAPTRHKGS